MNLRVAQMTCSMASYVNRFLQFNEGTEGVRKKGQGKKPSVCGVIKSI